MYENFYGLDSRPFQLTPDPHYYFESVTHRKALSYLGYGLAQGEGFIVITGDIGAGKTTLVSHLMATIDRERLTAANIVTTKVDGDDIIRLVADNFDIDTDDMDKAQILSAFEEFLHAEARSGRRCLLIVDETQNLAMSALEELRMLSNFQLGGQALLQIFLLGQPEFRDMLADSDQLEQLRQRVIAHHHLEPMDADEVGPYVTHRLAKSGWSGRPKMTSNIFQVLFEETHGVPRKINTLMSRILLMGSVEQKDLINRDLVMRVLADLKGENIDIDDPDYIPETEVPHDGKSPLLVKPAKPQNLAVDVQEAFESAGNGPGEPAADEEREVVQENVTAEVPEVTEPEVTEPEAVTEAAEPEVAEPKAVEEPEAAKEAAVEDHVEAVEPSLAAPQDDLDKAAVTADVTSTEETEAVEDDDVDHQYDALIEQVAVIEARLSNQEQTLQRALTMLVDWVESDVRSKESYIDAGRAA